MQCSATYRPSSFACGTELLEDTTKEEDYLFEKDKMETQSNNMGSDISRVRVKCESVDKQSFELLVNKYLYPGFKPLMHSNSTLVENAKMLGKTYKNKTNVVVKENLIYKQKGIMKPIQIKNILIPTDFSETGMLALEHATFMASLFKAHLYLLHVVEAFEYTYSIYEPQVTVKDTEEVHEVMAEKLEKLAEKISAKHGIHVSTLVGSGKPAHGIADAVKENNIDLIIMGTHGAKGFEEYFIGSNAHRVVNISPCPVITVQTHAKKLGFKNIVMPIDNSLHSRQKVNYVSLLASKYGSKVHILGLIDDDDETNEKRINIKLDSVENIIKKTGVPYTRMLKKGKNIAREAMDYSDKIKADLIVIMTDHESNLTGMFLGSLSKQIVNHSKIPVMSIKPNEGYFEAAFESWYH